MIQKLSVLKAQYYMKGLGANMTYVKSNVIYIKVASICMYSSIVLFIYFFTHFIYKAKSFTYYYISLAVVSYNQAASQMPFLVFSRTLQNNFA